MDRTEPLLGDEATLNIKDEEICAGLIEPVSMKNLKPRANSFQSTSSTASNESTVSIRHGHVYNIKTKKEIPVQHKLYVFLFIASTVIATLFIYSTYLSGNQSFFLSRTRFRSTDEKDDPVDWDQKDIVGFCLAAFFIMVAAGGGIGGGGVLVPTYILFLKFHPKYAIPLSNCTILGSSISNLALNAFKRHPQADRPLIDWDIMLMMEPLTIFGALIGTFINVVSPPWLITILLVIVLVLTAIKTLVKGFKSFAKESEKLAQKNAEQNGQPAGYKALTAGSKDKMGYQPPAHAAYGNQGKRDPTLEAIPLDPTGGRETAATVLAWTPEEVKQWWRRSLPPGCQEYLSIVDECELDGADLLDLDMESLMQFDVKKMLIMKILRRIKMLKKSLGIPENYKASGPAEVKTLGPKDADPRMEKAVAEGNTALIDILEIERYHATWKICLMFLLMGGCLTLTVLKGGQHFNLLDVHCGQTLYWVLTFAVVPWVFGISVIARNYLVDMYEQKENCGYEYLPHDVRWDARATVVYPLICSTAGLCAGMFGIGGGIIKGPLMLQMNVLPAVTSGTSASMILFTSSMASVSYILFGQLNYHYAWILALEGLIFTAIGQIALNKIVAYYQRASLIILVIGLVVAMSAVMMGWESFHYITELIEGNSEGGRNICAAKGEGRLL